MSSISMWRVTWQELALFISINQYLPLYLVQLQCITPNERQQLATMRLLIQLCAVLAILTKDPWTMYFSSYKASPPPICKVNQTKLGFYPICVSYFSVNIGGPRMCPWLPSVSTHQGFVNKFITSTHQWLSICLNMSDERKRSNARRSFEHCNNVYFQNFNIWLPWGCSNYCSQFSYIHLLSIGISGKISLQSLRQSLICPLHLLCIGLSARQVQSPL
jgi:hypothetical protein